MRSRLEQHPMRAKQCGTAFARLLRMRAAQMGSGEKKVRQLHRACGAAPQSRRIGLQAPCCPRLCHALVLIHRSIFLVVNTSPGESSLFAKPHIVRVLGQVQRQVRAHLRTESLLDCRRCGRIINVHDRCACGLHPRGCARDEAAGPAAMVRSVAVAPNTCAHKTTVDG